MYLADFVGPINHLLFFISFSLIRFHNYKGENEPNTLHSILRLCTTQYIDICRAIPCNKWNIIANAVVRFPPHVVHFAHTHKLKDTYNNIIIKSGEYALKEKK